MNTDFWWDDANSDGQAVARAHGLMSSKPTMCTTSSSGNGLYMFKSGDKYYIWNMIEGDIWEIVKPNDLMDIVTKIENGGLGLLMLCKVPQVAALSCI
jgi:hypothetical protein